MELVSGGRDLMVDLGLTFEHAFQNDHLLMFLFNLHLTKHLNIAR